ncbi:MAG TPA: TolC family protein, partial [Gemmatimonadales bacterium]|nr:TolC family protein [Gemmatimonadales bacterium]
MTRTLMLALVLAAAPATAQVPEPVRLTLGEAVRRASVEAPGVELATLRTEAARARVRQARAGLLPGLSAGAGWLNRTFNRASLGFDFPTAPGAPSPPDLIGPFDNVDARLRFTQPLLDWASVARIRASRSQVTGAEADAQLAAESAAQAAALAYL